jgi:AraC-like DNA-binding protein
MRNLIAIGHMGNNTYSFKAHKHDVWEISYYVYGEGTNTIGDQVIPFEPGVVICQPPGINHSEYAEKGYRNIYFSIRDFDSPPGIVPCFRDNEAKVVYNTLTQLNTEFYMRRINWKNICEALLNTAYQYMQSLSNGDNRNRNVEMLENLLISNITNHSLSIRKIMEGIPLSQDHARRIFVRETGKTPSEYLMEKRISFAKQLILTRTGNSSINFKTIAYQSGFDDPYYFSRVFKKLTGKSPTDWSKST